MKSTYQKIFCLVLVGLLVTLLGCAPAEIPITGDEQTPTPTAMTDEDSVLANTQWRLVSLGAEADSVQAVQGTDVTLQFDTGGHAEGYAGCNTFSADYSLTTEFGISFDQIISTEVACEDADVMAQETKFLNALDNARLFEYTSDSLRIWYDGDENALRFERMTN